MSFLSLYRKYRPEKFQDLIGQDQIKKTLKNALINDRVTHAYLFAGPRGTGKTSTAKVFAKSLNCANPSKKFEPCGECNSCQRIKKGNSLDVIEIDAASNRGIDEIRDLREKVKFYPGEGKYKVYIIDEVHMLTKGAFNALLKTLEEPPESVVFILATTEPHEVITTIMSRCQRFDFTLLSLSNLKKRLNYIAEKEGYHIDKQALDILARSARGGMRDAISLLDQAISFSDGQLSAEQISNMLGKISKDSLKDFLLHLSNRDSQLALELLNKQLEAGLGIERFSEELIEYCRELLLIKECGLDSGILEYSHSYLEKLVQVAANFSTEKITNIIDEFASLKQKLRSSARPRLQLEISVIKLSSKVKTSNSLEARISELEFKLDNFVKSNQLDQSQKNKTQNNQQKSKINHKVKSESKSAASKNTDLNNNFKEKESVQSSDLDLKKVKENWARFLQEIRQLDVSVQALLREGEPLAVKNSTIVIAFPKDKKFHYKGASSNQSLVERVLKNILNEVVSVKFQIGLKKKGVIEKSEPKDNSFKNNLNRVQEDSEKNKKTVEIKNRKENVENSNQSFNKDAEDNHSNSTLETDLDIEELAGIFSGEIIEVDQSILKDKGGN